MPKVVLNDTQEAHFFRRGGPGAKEGARGAEKGARGAKEGARLSRTPSLGEAVYASMISIVSTISISSTGANAR